MGVGNRYDDNKKIKGKYFAHINWGHCCPIRCSEQYIRLAFVYFDGGQCSCAHNLVTDQFRKKCKVYIIHDAFDQAKRHHARLLTMCGQIDAQLRTIWVL
jgi:hypothetical protein